MDYPAHFTAYRPRRSARTLIAGIAAFEFVLLIVAAVAIFGEPFSGEALAEPVDGEAQLVTQGKKAAVPELERSETSVLILNGTGRRGTAKRAAGLVRGLDYALAGKAAAPRRDVKRSLVMFRRGYKGEALRLASDVRVRRVVPLDGLRPRELGGAHVVLMLGKR